MKISRNDPLAAFNNGGSYKFNIVSTGRVKNLLGLHYRPSNKSNNTKRAESPKTKIF